jgi:uncharacterized protein (TIGR00730 family)
MRDVVAAVTVFGSSQLADNHPYFTLAFQLGQLLSNAEFSVLTGGGPGLMQAVTHGVCHQNGFTVGCHMALPGQPIMDEHVNRTIYFRYFQARKMTLLHYGQAYIVLPGGYGTFDELFEIASLIKTRCLASRPVILMVRSFWQPMLQYLSNVLLAHGMIDAVDISLFYVADRVCEVGEIIDNHINQL